MGVFDGSHQKSVKSLDVNQRDLSGWNMRNHKVTGVKYPDSTEDQQAAVTVTCLNEYFLHKKMNPTISSFSNELVNVSLNMSNNCIVGLPHPLVDTDACTLGFVKSHIYTSLSETLLWEYYTKFGNAMYRIDYGISSEVVMDSSTRKVSKLYDQSLYENHAEQTTTANQPTLVASPFKVNNRYYLNCNGSQRMLSNIKLNVASGGQGIVNIFIVYKLISYTGTYWLRNGLVGHDDAGL